MKTKRHFIPVTALLLAFSGCGVDKTLKREFRQASWQTFNVEVTSYASNKESSGLKAFWIQTPPENKLARESIWNPSVERALIKSGLTKSQSLQSAQILIHYDFENEGSGLRDWMGSYSRKLEIRANSKTTTKNLWELKATSIGTFEASDDKVIGVLAAAGLDFYGKNSEGTQKVKVSEENEIVREIIGKPSSTSLDKQ